LAQLFHRLLSTMAHSGSTMFCLTGIRQNITGYMSVDKAPKQLGSAAWLRRAAGSFYSGTVLTPKKAPCNFHCKGRIQFKWLHAVPPLLQMIVRTTNLPPSFAYNGSCRAVLEPLGDGLHIASCKTALSAASLCRKTGGSLCCPLPSYCSRHRFQVHHSTFFLKCKEFLLRFFAAPLNGISNLCGK
jgi:hypothetical protein